MYITPGSPRENGCRKSFNSRMVYKLLNREILDTLHEAKAPLSRWVRVYNTVRPRSASFYCTPAPEATLWTA